jgi:hypothetical protein
MRKVGEMLFHFPWYPLLVNTYAVLALFAYNISDVNHNVVWRPLIIVLVVTIVFLVFGRYSRHSIFFLRSRCHLAWRS